MRNTILILCILALSGCTSQSKKQSDESEETAFVLDSTIRIGDAIEKALPSMKLSKVVDSIVYVPLETKSPIGVHFPDAYSMLKENMSSK